MPRRLRPSHRAPPRSQGTVHQRNNAKLSAKSRQQVTKPFVASRHRSSNTEDRESHFSGALDEGYFDDESDENGDNDDERDEEGADVPRVAQWIDENEFEERDDEYKKPPKAYPSHLTKLQNDLSSLPFGALSRAEAVTGSEDEGGAQPGSDGDIPTIDSNKGREVEWSTQLRRDIAKRSNKHAPVEMTSKKPVTRLRQVVAVKKTEPRDPRFLSVAGEFETDKFQNNYSFLAEVHNSELGVLRDNLKRARKYLGNAPRHLRDDYEVEVQRLELAVKRAESIVNRERTVRIQREALQKAEKDERERRLQGKGSWYLKKAEKRELVTRAKYEALAADGGNKAVKEAIEKRQKKISQKEKRSRPFPKGVSTVAGGDDGTRKRRKIG